MVIQRTDRVAEVLRRNEALIETFLAASPHFSALRNPIMRRTMTRLATVEQAARVAGIDPDLLTSRLNRALAGGESTADPTVVISEPIAKPPADETMISTNDVPPPPALAAIASELVVDLDVREDLRRKQEPFSHIMAARREMPAGGVLRLRATFEPVPLYAVMSKQGLDHWTERLGEDDWRVSFFAPAAADVRDDTPADGAGEGVGVAAGPSAGGAVEEDVIVLDVRGMEPPEPMVRTLAALEELPDGKTLLQLNDRVPRFLLPKLESLGFTYSINEQPGQPARTFIRRSAVS